MGVSHADVMRDNSGVGHPSPTPSLRGGVTFTSTGFHCCQRYMGKSGLGRNVRFSPDFHTNGHSGCAAVAALQSSFLRTQESRYHGSATKSSCTINRFCHPLWIPAFAGMTRSALPRVRFPPPPAVRSAIGSSQLRSFNNGRICPYHSGRRRNNQSCPRLSDHIRCRIADAVIGDHRVNFVQATDDSA